MSKHVLVLVSKKVLILSASPRKGGNSDLLCDQFAKGAEEAGHQVEKVCLRDRKINGCLGCGACQRNGGTCVQKDDMEKIYAAIERADVIVESFPLYFYGLPGTLKTMTDRCLPYTKAYGWSKGTQHELRDPKMLEKRLVLISTCWHTGIEQLYAAVRAEFDLICGGKYETIFCPQGELFVIESI